LTWLEFRQVEKKVAVPPVGVAEARGPHPPLGTDVLTAVYVTEGAAEEAGALLMPPI